MEPVLADRYHLLTSLLETETTRTFLAVDRRREHEVAVTILRNERATRLNRRRFRKEFSTFSLLMHPWFPRVYDYESLPENIFYTREVTAGADLAVFLARPENAEPETVLRIVSRVAGALNHLRRRNLPFGEITPAGVLVRRGSNDLLVKVVNLNLRDGAAVPGMRGFAAHLMRLLPQNVLEEPRLKTLFGRMMATKPGQRLADPGAVLTAVRGLAGGTEALEPELELFGRESALDAIRRALRAAYDGAPGTRVVAVRGAAGSGRTAVLDAARVEAEFMGFRVGSARAADGMRVPYREAKVAFAAVGPPWPPLRRPFAETAELKLAVTAKLLESASRAPMVLIFDDLDFADDDTRDLIEHLAAVLALKREVRLALLVASQQEMIPRERALDIELKPLERPNLSKLASWWGGTPPSDGLVDDLLRMSGGYPGLAREILDASRERIEAADSALRLKQDQGLALPEERRAAVLARFDSLEALEREILDILAISPGGLPMKALRAATGRSALSSVLDRLIDTQWIEEEGNRWRLASAFAARVLEGRMDVERNRGLHRRMARSVEYMGGQLSFDRLNLIAHHYLHAGDAEPAQAWGFRLGQRLVQRHAYLAAGEAFTRAAGYGGGPASAAWKAACDSWKRAGRCAQMIEAARARVEVDPSAEARADLAEALKDKGNFMDALQVYQEVLEDPSIDSSMRARCLLARAGIWGVLRKPTEEGEALAQARASGAADELQLMIAEGQWALNRGEAADAVTLLERALQAARERRDSREEHRILWTLGRTYYHPLSTPRLARRYFQNSQRVAKRMRLRALVAHGQGWQGTVLDAMGRHAKALKLKRWALEAGIQSGQWMTASNNAHNLAALAVLHGDATEAERAAQLCIEFAERTGERYAKARAHAIQAVVAAQRGLLRTAERWLDEAESEVQGEDPAQTKSVLLWARALVLWNAGTWKAGEKIFKAAFQTLVEVRTPITAIPVLVALAECAYHRKTPLEPELIERLRHEVTAWDNRFAEGALYLVDGYEHLKAGSRRQASSFFGLAQKAFQKDVGVDFHLCFGLASARANLIGIRGAGFASKVHQSALSHGRLRYAEEAAELLGDAAAQAGEWDEAARWHQEALRMFTDRRSEWFENQQYNDDALARERELREKAEAPSGASGAPPWRRRLKRMNRTFGGATDLTRGARDVLEALVELSQAERGFLFLSQNDKLMAQARHVAAPATPGLRYFRAVRAIAQWVLDREELVHSADASEDERLRDLSNIHSLKGCSVLCFPLRIQGRGLGVVYLDSRRGPASFDEVDLQEVETVRDHATQVVYRLLLEEEVKRLRKERDELAEKAGLTGTERRRGRAKAPAEGRPRHPAFARIIGESETLSASLRLLERASASDSSVLILGETGTGKELAARAVHDAGARARSTFLAVNCAALPETTLEAELFGHVKGAFTGADRDRPGLFQAAHGGTLFLDEIGEMSPGLQSKLLRAIESHEVRRVGNSVPEKVDVRLIAASNRDLPEMAKSGLFRPDLLYRLRVLQVTLPPLRKRMDDIPLLVDDFLGRGVKGRRRAKMDTDAMRELFTHDWPGNVRELKHVIEALVALGEERITRDDVRRVIDRSFAPSGNILRTSVDRTEKQIVMAALRAERTVRAAAKKLGVARSQFYRLLEKYKLQRTKRT
ncbi:MAG: sigma 54-interacting transcriptional regulator [Planctomycetes bacterium]|nr:sigma 54-interacting transcriptional regulator [Planctomycetota bacterium]